ncbi:MAG TPA: heparan-alpha-glucosaminide N-acetyltransferase domain-containing protein, partial [Chryseolinea sp.]
MVSTSDGVLVAKARISSIDTVRGFVMVIMALDHVRDYFHIEAFNFNPTDMERTSVALFFTRWITHICAPTFVLLSGVSARLGLEKKSKKELSIHLLSRGLWLILLEITV